MALFRSFQNFVALRKESVDRNKDSTRLILIPIIVALRKESVDRNFAMLSAPFYVYMSLSARRAWIEICACRGLQAGAFRSLSARRAWIEIRSV